MSRPIHFATPWFKAPFYARRKFSPRLLLAWLTCLYIVRIVEHWLAATPTVLNGTLVPVQDPTSLIVALLGLVAALLALGTAQTVALGDTAPAPGIAEAAAGAPADTTEPETD